MNLMKFKANTYLFHSIIVAFFALMLWSPSVVLGQCPANGSNGALINEISNLSSEGEFVELVVVGDPMNPTANVDLTGWILDDNNTTMTGNGNAAGYAILGACLNSVPPGSIIVIYDDSNIPTGITTANDGTPNAMGVYQIPISSSCISGCSSNPSASGGTITTAYLPCGTSIAAGAMTWGPITMANSNDVMQIRDPNATLFHALYWNVADYPGSGDASSVEITETSLSDESVQLGCGSWWMEANYNVVSGTSTPGAANDADNQTLISAIAAGTACETDNSGNLAANVCVASACDITNITAGTFQCASDGLTYTITVTVVGTDASVMIDGGTGATPSGPQVATGTLTFTYADASSYSITVTDSDSECSFGPFAGGPIDCTNVPSCNAVITTFPANGN